MSYANYDNLIGRYPSMSKWAPTPTEVNSNLIFFAERYVEVRLSSRFTVPFDGTPPTVLDLVLNAAYAQGMLTREPDLAAKVQKALDDRIDGILAGKEYLITGSGTSINPSGGGSEVWSSTGDYHPVFSMLDAEHPGSHVSSSQLYDEEDERA